MWTVITKAIKNCNDNDGDMSEKAEKALTLAKGIEAASAIASDDRLKASECASSVKKNWHNRMLSDEAAKVSSDISAGAGKAAGALGAAADLGTSLANAGLAATGQPTNGAEKKKDDSPIDWAKLKDRFGTFGKSADATEGN